MKTKKNKIHFLPSVLIFLAVVLLIGFLFNRAVGNMDTDGGKTLKTALENSATLCYSLEGFYPPSLDYLINNYGVVLDKEHYIVNYEVFASNIMPDIRVVVK